MEASIRITPGIIQILIDGWLSTYQGRGKVKDSKASRANMVAQHPLYVMAQQSTGGTAGGTVGCEFKYPHWQLFFMGLDWILLD